MIDVEPLKRFIRREFLFDESVQLEGDQQLFPDIIDSLGVMNVVDFVEETYGVSIDEDELVVDNFSTLDAIAALIERKQA